jgi:hypothetical protein
MVPVPDPFPKPYLDPDPTSNKMKKYIKIIKSERPTYWEIMLILVLKRQDFAEIFVC